jgi:TonB family protein
MLTALANHVWQSTLCIGAAAIVAWMLRRHPAKLRYRVWLFAALKFLIPFSLLVALGARLPWPATSLVGPDHVAVQVIVTPFTNGAHDTADRTATPTAGMLALWVSLCAWGAGLIVVSSRRMLHRRRLQLIARAAEPLFDGPETNALDRARNALGLQRHVEIRSSPEPLAPGVIGIVRPIILWPAGLSSSLTPAELDAVFLHELSHVRRADNLIAALYAVLQTALWFNPAIWWLGARLIRERERACDEAVLNTGAKPPSYAAGLLKVCRFCLQSPFGWAAAATGSDLTRRVEAIMSGRTERTLGVRSRILLLAAVLAVIVLPIGAGALARDASARDPQTVPPVGVAHVTTLDVMLATPLIHSGNGATKDIAISGAPTAPAATRQDAALATSEAVNAAPSPEPGPSASLVRVAEEVQGPVRVGGDIREPKKIKDLKPAYPEEAKANGVQGIVIMEAVIDVDGRVADIKVLRGHPLLNQAALDAVSQWEFTPTLLNGQPVQVLMTVTINFTLQ